MHHTISRMAFLAALLAAAPAWAQTASGDQDSVTAPRHRHAHSAEADSPSDYFDAADIPQRPSVVAPLQPTSLGTLKTSELNGVSQDTGAGQAAPIGTTKLQAPQLLSATAPAVTAAPVLRAPQLPQPAVATVPPATVVPAAPVPVAVAPVPVPPPMQAAPAATAVAAAAPVQTTAKNNQVAPNHVGEAPVAPTKPPEVQALANVGGVLTPYGKLVIEPFLEYSRSSVNSFVFQGVEVVNALLIGAVDANRTARDLVSTGATFRVGVSDRAEVEVKVPYVWRQDSITDTIANTNNQTTTTNAQGYGLGDIEVAGHYQVNEGHDDWPFFVANLRYKSDTGSSPYNSEYNSDGTAHTLATGSGFMAVEPSITAIYPSDPATLFANLGYIHSFDENINHKVGNVQVGNVAPGDTYMGSLGMGVALNDKLSFTLGYEHDYVRPTATVVSGATQNSQSLQVGSALSGISYKVNDRTSVVANLAAGVTKDAPDAVISLRVPITLQAF